MKRGILPTLVLLQVLSLTIFADELRTLEREERLKLIDQITAVLREGGNLHAKDAHGRPTPYLAALAEDARIVTILLQAGVQVNQTDKDGYTPLHVAAMNGNLEIAALLLKAGAEINAVGNEGRSPLFIAARENRSAVVAFLLEQGADPFLPKQGGWTPMHTAAAYNAVDAMKVLHKAGIPLDITNRENGWTPLHAAAAQGGLDACRYLLEQGVDVNARTFCHCTSLMYAAENGHAEVIELLCAEGAKVQVYNCKGYTPLLLAVEKNALNPVSVLLNHNADINALTPAGLNVINLAVRNDNPSMLGLLVSRGADPSQPNGEGNPPLYDALVGNMPYGEMDSQTIKMLITLGSDINVPTLYELWSPLYAAQRVKDDFTTAFLKKHNAVDDPFRSAPPAFVPDTFLTKDHWGNPAVEFTPEFERYLDDYFAGGGDWKVTDEAGNTLLHWFAEYNNEKGVRRLLDAGMSPDVRNKLGRTPLTRTARISGFDNILRILLDAGGDIDASDFLHNRAIHYAALQGFRSAVNTLLERKAVPDAPNRFGVTPLHYACIRSSAQNRDTAAALLAAGASVKARDYAGQTPLHIVSANTFEMIDIIQTMIRQGAQANQPDSMGRYPLHLAVHSDRIVLALIQNGATVDVVDRFGRTPLSYAILKQKPSAANILIETGADLNRRDYANGWTPLHWAARIGDAQTAQRLIDKGADSDARSHRRQTPLDIAKEYRHTAVVQFFENKLQTTSPDYDPQKAAELAAQEKQRDQIASRERTRMFWLYREPGPLFTAVLESNPEKVRQALQDGDEFDEQLNVDNVNIYTPLHGAVYFEDEPMVRLLVELGADLNILRPKHGGRPLHVAAMNGSLPMTRLLAELGADLRAADNSGETPFRRAVIHRAQDVIRFYLSNGIDINEKDGNQGWTALHMAAYNHGPIELLLSLGADINARDSRENTPLHNAMRLYEKKETVDLLLAAGADINALNRRGGTPLIEAFLANQYNNARFLIEAGADVNIGAGYAGEPAVFMAGGELDLVQRMVERGADLTAVDRSGGNAVHSLVRNKQGGTFDVQTFEYFLEQGLDINAVDNDKRTPLYHAIESKRYDMLRLLIQHGADINVEDKWLSRPIEYAYNQNDTAAMKILLQHGAVADPEHEINRKSRVTSPDKPSFQEVVEQLTR